ncbi:MAG: prephenate dehydrogenase/arogenate dehydrogenase family protein [Methanophagales archaeon ANME-1-THS]|nr:MAG: prephenate dehydrogenase/arogenate dehydrogenase family protein [Methanophagales archaeon ANME-1-THS]
MRITILGGAGGMGEWFARFFDNNDFDVRIVDITDNTEAVAKRLGVEFLVTDLLKLKPGAVRDALGDADIVLLSVPIAVTGGVIERVGPELHEGSLLMDITSVKRMPMAMMERWTNERVEILGTHPLFGPSAKSMRGQSVIFVPLRSGPLSERLYKLFVGSGAKVEFLTAAEHDQLFGVIQGLTHFILFSLGLTLRELNFDIERSRNFMTPMYEILIDFMGRLLHQDPQLYAEIQTNFEMHEIHKAFLRAAMRLSELVADRNLDEFMDELLKARRYFGNTERALIDSDRILEEKLKLSLEED